MTYRGDWIPKLQCHVDRISYDFAMCAGEVWMPDGSCTDMQGAIDYFVAIDPGVTSIITWAGGKIDTQYIRLGDGWKAQ